MYELRFVEVLSNWFIIILGCIFKLIASHNHNRNRNNNHNRNHNHNHKHHHNHNSGVVVLFIVRSRYCWNYFAFFTRSSLSDLFIYFPHIFYGFIHAQILRFPLLNSFLIQPLMFLLAPTFSNQLSIVNYLFYFLYNLI